MQPVASPALPEPVQPRSLFGQLREAIRGTQADYTKIPLRRAVFLLAVPMVLELVLESTSAVVDIFFVARLGPSAVATVGLTESYLFLLYSIAIGLAMAVTAVVARRVGEGQADEAAVTAVQAIIVALLASLLPAIVGILYAPDLLRLMGGDDWTIQHGYRYAQWMLGGNAVIMLLFVINAIFRGAGDAAIAMRVLWLSNGLNILLCPLLIFGVGPFPEWGIEGAAIATNIGRGTGVLVQLWVLLRGGQHIRVLASHLRWQGAVLWKVGLVMGGCNLVGGYVGARVAVSRGARFVRVFFVLVVSAFAVKIGGDPILVYAVKSSQMDEEALSWFLDDVLARRITKVPGVGRFLRVGGVDREIAVEIDSEAAMAIGVTPMIVSRALESMQKQLSGGRGEFGERDQSVRVSALVPWPPCR